MIIARFLEFVKTVFRKKLKNIFPPVLADGNFGQSEKSYQIPLRF